MKLSSFAGLGNGIKPGTSFDPTALETFTLPPSLGTAELGRAALYIPGLGVNAAKNNAAVLSGVNVPGGGNQKVSRLVKISSTVYVLAVFQLEPLAAYDHWTHPTILLYRLLLDPSTGMFSITQQISYASQDYVYVALSNGYQTEINSFNISYSSTTDTLAIVSGEYYGTASSSTHLSIFKNVIFGTMAFASYSVLSSSYSSNGTCMFHPNYPNVLITSCCNVTKTFTVSAAGILTAVTTFTSAFVPNTGSFDIGGALAYYTGDLFVTTDGSNARLISVNSVGTMATVAQVATALALASKIIVNAGLNKVLNISNGSVSVNSCNLTSTTITSVTAYTPAGLTLAVNATVETVTTGGILAYNKISNTISVLTFDGSGVLSNQGTYKLNYKMMPAINTVSTYAGIKQSFYYEDGHFYVLVDTVLARVPVGSLSERYIGKYVDSSRVQAKYVYTNAAVGAEFDNKTVFATNKAMLTVSPAPLIKSVTYDISGNGAVGSVFYNVFVSAPDSFEVNWNSQQYAYAPITAPVADKLGSFKFIIQTGNWYYNFKMTEYQYDF